METITQVFEFPNRWTDKFIKNNATFFIKRDYKAKTAKCIELVRTTDGKQKLTYQITK